MLNGDKLHFFCSAIINKWWSKSFNWLPDTLILHYLDCFSNPTGGLPYKTWILHWTSIHIKHSHQDNCNKRYMCIYEGCYKTPAGGLNWMRRMSIMGRGWDGCDADLGFGQITSNNMILLWNYRLKEWLYQKWSVLWSSSMVDKSQTRIELGQVPIHQRLRHAWGFVMIYYLFIFVFWILNFGFGNDLGSASLHRTKVGFTFFVVLPWHLPPTRKVKYAPPWESTPIW